MNPSAFVGQKGGIPGRIEEIDTALAPSELIKIKFTDHREKEDLESIPEQKKRSKSILHTSQSSFILALKTTVFRFSLTERNTAGKGLR